MTIYNDIDVQGVGQTTDATPQDIGFFSFANNSSGWIRTTICMTRSDGRCKAWIFDALLQRTTTAATIKDSKATVLVNASDVTPLTGVSVALSTYDDQVSVSCTGQAGQTIDWCVRHQGRVITPE